MWSWSCKDVGRLVGIVTAGSRASLAPVRISREAIDYVRDEMLAIIDDVVEGRRYLGVFKGSVKRDLALDSSSLPSIFDPEKGYGYSAPIMSGYVEIVGEIKPTGGLELSFSIPRPGSLVYTVERGEIVSQILKLPPGLRIGRHKFAGIHIDLDPTYLNYHIAVLGATGTGKSRLVKAIVEEVLAKTTYSVIVFDHTGMDYADPARWQGLEPTVISARRFVLDLDVIAEIMAEKMGLTHYHEDYIFTALAVYVSRVVGEGGRRPQDRQSRGAHLGRFDIAEPSIDFESIIASYRSASKSGEFRWDYNAFIQTLQITLRSLNVKEQTITKYSFLLALRLGRKFFEGYLSGRDVLIDDLVLEALNGSRRLIIVDLSTEPEYEAKNFIVYQFVRTAWEHTISGGKRTNLLFVVDEAHNYACFSTCRPASEEIARTAREGRKWGLGLVLASQRIVDLAPEVRGNINTVFFSRLQTAGDYSELRNWVEGVDLLEGILPLLAPREFFFSGLGNSLRRPLLIKVRDVA